MNRDARAIDAPLGALAPRVVDALVEIVTA